MTILGEIVCFRTRPESHLSLLRIASTGKIKSDRYDMVGLETALKFGSLTVFGEYTKASVNAIDGGQVDSATLATNYYINTYMRAMFNVVSANGDEFVCYDSTSASARLQIFW